jgi:hypothetical protein
VVVGFVVVGRITESILKLIVSLLTIEYFRRLDTVRVLEATKHVGFVWEFVDNPAQVLNPSLIVNSVGKIIVTIPMIDSGLPTTIVKVNDDDEPPLVGLALTAVETNVPEEAEYMIPEVLVSMTSEPLMVWMENDEVGAVVLGWVMVFILILKFVDWGAYEGTALVMMIVGKLYAMDRSFIVVGESKDAEISLAVPTSVGKVIRIDAPTGRGLVVVKDNTQVSAIFMVLTFVFVTQTRKLLISTVKTFGCDTWIDGVQESKLLPISSVVKIWKLN